MSRPGAVLVLLALAGCAEPQPSRIPDWQAPTTYEFTLDSSCGERALIGRFHVVVEAGDVVAAEGLDESGRAMLEQGFEDAVPTLTGLLAEAGTARDQGAEVVDVQTTDDGRPTRVDIDWEADATDDEACYRITDFSEDVEESDISAGEASAAIHAAAALGDGRTIDAGSGEPVPPQVDDTTE